MGCWSSFGGRPLLIGAALLLFAPGTAHGMSTLVGTVTGGPMIRYVAIDPATGDTTDLATSPLESGSNFAFEIDSVNAIAYQLGRANGSLVIGSTDLATGATHTIPIVGVPDIAVFGETLVGAFSTSGDIEYRSIDPDTGATTPLATAPIQSAVIASFHIDSSGVAYQRANIGGQAVIASTNLLNGATRTVPIAGFPLLDVLRGQLIGAFDSGQDTVEYRTIDPETGVTVLLATSPLESGTNFQLTIDDVSRTAYQLGRIGGDLVIAATNLKSGAVNVIPASGVPLLAVLEVPEPSTAALVGLGLVLLCGSRRRHSG